MFKKPFAVMTGAVLLLVVVSQIKVALTGSFMVDTHPIYGVAMYPIVFLFFLSIGIGTYGYFKIVFNHPGYQLTLRQTGLLAMLIAVISAFMAPMLSNDITRYLANGELLTQGITTYIDGSLHRQSKFVEYISFHWLDTPSFYGPPLLYIFYASVLLGGKTIVGSMIAYKGFILFFSLLYIAFVIRYIKKFASRKYNMAALLTLAPILWVQGSGQGHNEVVIIAFAMMGIYFLRTNKYFIASFFLALAALSKTMYTIVFAPFFALYLLKKFRGDWIKILKIYLVSAIIVALSGTFLYQFIWESPETLTSALTEFDAASTPTKSHVEIITDFLVYAGPVLGIGNDQQSDDNILTEDVKMDQQKIKYWNFLIPFFKAFGIALALFTMLSIFKVENPKDALHIFAKIWIISICFYSHIVHPWYLMLALPFFIETESKRWIKYIVIVFSLVSVHEIMFTIPRDNPFYWIIIPIIFLTVLSYFLYFRKNFILETFHLLKGKQSTPPYS